MQVRLTDAVTDDVPRALSLAQSRFYRLANEDHPGHETLYESTLPELLN